MNASKNNSIRIAATPTHVGSQFIAENFQKRKKGNQRYSIRAFANYLGVDHSSLAKVMKGESLFSRQVYIKVLEKLDAPPEVMREILRMGHRDLVFGDISDDDFQLISNWVYFAILELMTIDSFELTGPAIAKKLGITEIEAQGCLDKLCRLNFITLENGAYRALRSNNTWYPKEATSEAKRNFQAMLLDQSKLALERDFSERDHSSVILALNSSEILVFKEWLKDARRQLTKLFQKTKPFDEVYCLQLSLFPLSNKNEVGNETLVDPDSVVL